MCLLLAGDIVPFVYMKKHNYFFDYVSDNFKTTYWIPGNHEYYHYDAANKSGVINEQIRHNVFLVNNQVVRMNNVRFIFTTLWTKISVANQLYIQQHLNDFHQIQFNGNVLTPEVYNRLHQDCLDFLKSTLAEKDDCKTVVATHHLPTNLNYPEKYRNDILNEAFAVELFDLIEGSGIDFWIYGHHHTNIPEFEIGKTKLLTNQMGYVKYGEDKEFRRDAKVEIIEQTYNQNSIL